MYIYIDTHMYVCMNLQVSVAPRSKDNNHYFQTLRSLQLTKVITL